MPWSLQATGAASDGDKVKQMAEEFFTNLSAAGVQVSSLTLTNEGVDVPLNTPGLRSPGAVAAGMTPPQAAQPTPVQPAPAQPAQPGQAQPEQPNQPEQPETPAPQPSRSSSQARRSGSKSR